MVVSSSARYRGMHRPHFTLGFSIPLGCAGASTQAILNSPARTRSESRITKADSYLGPQLMRSEW